jgi:hypothetical protein
VEDESVVRSSSTVVAWPRPRATAAALTIENNGERLGW